MTQNRVIQCNYCGKEYQFSGEVLKHDLLHVKKQWGYFSKKDGIIHEFYMCEDCYDKWLENFAIPPSKKNAAELM